jgi:hypothetical protein
MFNESVTHFLATERIRGFQRDAHRAQLVAMAECSRGAASIVTRAHRGLMRLAHKITVARGHARSAQTSPGPGPARYGTGEDAHGSPAGPWRAPCG